MLNVTLVTTPTNEKFIYSALESNKLSRNDFKNNQNNVWKSVSFTGCLGHIKDFNLKTKGNEMTTIYVNEMVEGEEVLNDYTPTLMKDVKKGEFFTTAVGSKTKFVRGDYDRSSKKYYASAWEGCREGNFKGSKVVYVGFTY
jgi:hypothetical protein